MSVLEQVAFANIALASAGTIVAGATGYMDNIKNYDGAAPNASVKIILAILLFRAHRNHQHRPLSQPGSVSKIQSISLCRVVWPVFCHRARACISGWRHSIRVLGERIKNEIHESQVRRFAFARWGIIRLCKPGHQYTRFTANRGACFGHRSACHCPGRGDRHLAPAAENTPTAGTTAAAQLSALPMTFCQCSKAAV